MKTKLLAVLLSSVAAPAFAASEVPGWYRAGSAPVDYAIGIDREVSHEGHASAYLKSTTAKPDDFGTLMQMSDAKSYHGQRVRMTAFVRTSDATKGAQLWFRVDGKGRNVIAMDNMHKRPIVGTTAWQAYSLVLDVPAHAVNLAFGLIVSGTGTAWIDDVRFETVDKSVSTTDVDESFGAAENLDFEATSSAN
jgi:hypothetical protein